MQTHAADLKEFYDHSRGKTVQRVLRRHIRAIWPEVRGLRVMGYGYAVPYLRPFMVDAEKVFSLMPASQGAVYWPPDDKSLTALVDGDDWPVETDSIDRLLVMHGVSSPEELDAVLREAFRVLRGQGRLLLCVPNRTGLWARFDAAPFGHGMPYSMGQIRHILKDHMFVPEQTQHGLFVPPFSSRLMLATAPAWERVGMRFFSAFGGVNIIEASRQIYAGLPAVATANTLSPAQNSRRRVVQIPGARTGI